MTVTAVTIRPPLNVNQPIVDKNGVMRREFVQYITALINSFQLLLGDTTAGTVTQNLPPAASFPNQEVFAIKTSSDVHSFILAAQGSDVISKQGAWAASTLTVGTAQGAAVRLKSDGNSSWYVI